MKMDVKQLMVAGALTVIASNALAGTYTPYTPMQPVTTEHFYAYGLGGAVFNDVQKQEYTAVFTGGTYTFIEQSTDDARWTVGGGAGMKWPLYEEVILGLGVSVFYISDMDVRGSGVAVSAAANPFTGIAFGYETHAVPVFGELTLDSDCAIYGTDLVPHFVGGIGASYNTVDKVFETPMTMAAGYAPFLASKNTSTDFAWELGMGLGKRFSKNLRFAIEYRYMGLGKAKLAMITAGGAVVDLSTAHIHAHVLGGSVIWDM